MQTDTIALDGMTLQVVTCNTVVVGSGAAGYSAAVRLIELGQRDILLLSEGRECGTSRNTGSDKQTYYKLGLSGDVPDCPQDMARDLFAGGCVDGDHALVEAALSARCFYALCELGVPFPCNRYGEYIGYKTDHDPRARATSCGPLTSQLMTQALEAKAEEHRLTLCDHQMAVAILKEPGGEEVVGLLAVDLRNRTGNPFRLYRCTNLVYATGGPAGIYQQSVYPQGHFGASGIAIEAGARSKNLTEWQYGLASISPRWNVSGTYMQVLPRFLSVDPDGDEHDFLYEFFQDERELLSLTFRKGYQWPFDCQKAVDGSSLIDLLVYRERELRGRRVFLDYTSNPGGHDALRRAMLDPEAYAYLESAQALHGAPIDRLIHMNRPAYELYLSKGVDLKKDRLEIALCAQHSNGGLDVDAWWQSSLAGFFVVGEAAGTHGVHRPGGSALNAGQVGALRAAQYITRRRMRPPCDMEHFQRAARPVLQFHRDLLERCVGTGDTAHALLDTCRSRMSEAAGAIRSPRSISKLYEDVTTLLQDFTQQVRIPDHQSLQTLYRLRDVLLTQRTCLFSMLDYVQQGGLSRGSAIYESRDGGLREGLEDCFRFQTGNDALGGMVQLIVAQGDALRSEWRPVRPLPEGGGVFETVWRDYRMHQNID